MSDYPRTYPSQVPSGTSGQAGTVQPTTFGNTHGALNGVAIELTNVCDRLTQFQIRMQGPSQISKETAAAERPSSTQPASHMARIEAAFAIIGERMGRLRDLVTFVESIG